MKIITNYLLYTIIFAGVVSCGVNVTSNPVKDGSIDTKKEKSVKTIHLTKADFLTKVMNYEKNPNEWKYLGDKPAIIDFYALWCGPCRSIAPILEELAEEYDGQIYIYKIDTEKERELSAAFGITSIPTLLFIPMGESPQISQGALPRADLKEIVDNVLLKKKLN
ncbi:MAG: thioredoxin [Bacteroidales bacterium]